MEHSSPPLMLRERFPWAIAKIVKGVGTKFLGTLTTSVLDSLSFVSAEIPLFFIALDGCMRWCFSYLRIRTGFHYQSWLCILDYFFSHDE